MSSLGVVMMVHTDLHRAAQLARHWSEGGCPVVLHVDQKVPNKRFDKFKRELEDLPDIRFCKRRHCEWGKWSLVAASQDASELMLETFPSVQHVYLASGACLPLRPVRELVEYLEKRPKTDFIESATIRDVPWTVGGLDMERFTLRFPFSWKTQRRLFDRYVRLQRRLKFRRKIPDGITPHMGSQWWCLTRQTLSAILEGPEREKYDAYFKRVWIPDESYYQTLARCFSVNIESRSLTLSKFDLMGKPHIFYDDHLPLLKRSDCFVARKVWVNADKLYDKFLSKERIEECRSEPDPAKIDRIFSQAVMRRKVGRPGLVNQCRFPREGSEHGLSAAPYTVLEGFSDLFVDFEDWLEKSTTACIHGHIFDKERAQFAGRGKVFAGCLSDDPVLRDYAPTDFLRNLIWNTRGEKQVFQFGPRDTQDTSWFMAKDVNASIIVVTGAWAVPLFHSNRSFSEIREIAAEQQRIESDHVDILRSYYAKARVQIYTLAEFVQSPTEPMQRVIDEIGPRTMRRITEAPRMVDLTGFGKFLQNLKNQGMHPYLVGDFPIEGIERPGPKRPRKPYLVN
ncbi:MULTISPECIES: beta-1,6-N-acetylglucosaminyltransferase [Halocynthiibacter]|uniref:Peptide O-xylosyltransferase n=1 Tax=Halocynthiibacter halioticoli TaxID=2986804 RepID=A0AAE3J2J7_9RHOB|nr:MULTISPECIES: beta-1,6-N-acetylglucosaminyltransferase [Halocynthiibacter]MCV6825548.1 beta-1,6-N-acetylglucosaminyltransferase [Halocynthiibacter halioticoli]MCW4058549.1 beta-1,6-N-acetylglucosaminyltransferase [Halocynthiibacter sp. SDUM655004]